MNGLFLCGCGDAGLLFAVIQIQAVPLPQHRKEGAGQQIMLLQAGGQRGGNIGRFDKGGLAVENAQAGGDSIGIFSQHQMEPPGKLLVALHLRHGPSSFRPQATIGGT